MGFMDKMKGAMDQASEASNEYSFDVRVEGNGDPYDATAVGKA